MVLKLGLKGVHQRHHYCDGLARRVLAGFKHLVHGTTILQASGRDRN